MKAIKAISNVTRISETKIKSALSEADSLENGLKSAIGAKLTKIPAKRFIDKYPKGHCDVLKNVTTHHPRRFSDVWAEGTFILVPVNGDEDSMVVVKNGDVLAAQDGAARVGAIFQVR